MIFFNRIKTIRAKLMLSTSALFIIVTIAFILFNYVTQSNEIISNKKHLLKQEYEQVLGLFNYSAFRAYSLAEWVANMPDVQKYFSERDRAKLQELTLPIYESVKQRLNIDKFQFHTPPATSFLRLHKPEKYDDDLSKIRPTVVWSNNNQKKAMGLDFGVCGFGIRGVTPVFHNGKHLGTVEFGVALNDNLVMSLKHKYGFDISILVPDNQAFKFQARTHKMQIPKKSYHILKNIITTGQIEIHRINKEGRKLLTLFGPLKDFSGNVKGVIAIPLDISVDINEFENLLILYALIGVISLLSILTVIYWIMNKLILKRIVNIKEGLSIASQGNLKYRIQIDTDDEMGEISQSINTFLENLSVVIETLSENSELLTDSSEILLNTSKQMSNNSSQTSDKADAVAAAAEEMSSNINGVAATVEELSTSVGIIADSAQQLTYSIDEITKNTDTAKKITSSAVTEAISASEKVDELGIAAQEINKVTEVINEISKQTNLLALNATIEAARAGKPVKDLLLLLMKLKILPDKRQRQQEKLKIG